MIQHDFKGPNFKTLVRSYLVDEPLTKISQWLVTENLVAIFGTENKMKACFSSFWLFLSIERWKNRSNGVRLFMSLDDTLPPSHAKKNTAYTLASFMLLLLPLPNGRGITGGIKNANQVFLWENG